MSEVMKDPKPKRAVAYDRYVIDDSVKTKMSAWAAQVQTVHGDTIKVSRSDLLNVILLRHADELSTQEVKAIWERCFDTVEFTKRVTTDLALAQKRNEAITIETVIERLRMALPDQARPIHKRAKSQSVAPQTSSKKLCGENPVAGDRS